MRRLLTICSLCLAGPIAGVSDLEAKPNEPVSEVYATADDVTQLTWEAYTPATPGPWPAVLVIHGGFWTAGSESDAGPSGCAQDLAEAGYLAFSIAYRLAPPGSIPGQKSSGRFPDQVNDVQLAVRAARHDPRSNGQVGGVGGSSGASHVAWVAVTGTQGDDRLDVGICLSGAYDLSDFSPDPNLAFFIQIVTNYVGVDQTDTDALRAASPASALSDPVSPLFLFDTVNDLMPAVQFEDMAAKLTAGGVTNFRAVRLPGEGHSFEYWPRVKNDAIGFLADGFAKPPPTPTPTPTGTPTPTPTPTITPTPTPSPSATPTPLPLPDTLLNISTRATAGRGENALIGGFILGNGNDTKKVIVRALGPSLASQGVAAPLADPSLQLFDAQGRLVASNNDWMTGGQAQEIIDSKIPPADPRESAIVASLSSGGYTAVVTGDDKPSHIALVEVYDLDPAHQPQLVNISTRGRVETGEGVMIAGTIIGGTDPETVVIRGLGPSLASSQISDPLPDPHLTLVDSQGTELSTNDNWQDSADAPQIVKAGLALPNPLEAAIFVTLSPGHYTALMSDSHGVTGIGLVEMYHITSSQAAARQ